MTPPTRRLTMENHRLQVRTIMTKPTITATTATMTTTATMPGMITILRKKSLQSITTMDPWTFVRQTTTNNSEARTTNLARTQDQNLVEPQECPAPRLGPQD